MTVSKGNFFQFVSLHFRLIDCAEHIKNLQYVLIFNIKLWLFHLFYRLLYS